MPRDLAGERLGQARGIGKLGTKPIRLSDAIEPKDNKDWYHFSLGTRSRLDLDVEVPTPNVSVGVQVLKLKGNRPTMLKAIGNADASNPSSNRIRRFLTPIQTRQFDGKGDDQLQLRLDAGEYYVRIFRQKGNSPYTLTLDATAESSSSPTKNTPTKGAPPKDKPTKGTPTNNNPSNPPAQPQPPAPAPQPVNRPTLVQVAPTWIKQFGGTDNDYAYGTAIDRNGTVFVTGVNGATKNSFVAAYSSDGTQLWQRELSLPGTDMIYDVALDNDGNYYVAGAANVTSKGSDGIVVKYDSSGTELWREPIATIALGTENVADAASSLALDSAGNVYVTGFLGIAPTAATPQLGNAFVTKLDGQTGDPISTFGQNGMVEIGGEQADAAGGIAIAANGNLYIGGITNAKLTTNLSRPFADGDAFITALNSTTGAQLWSRTLAGDTGGQDYARSIALDGQGNIYLAGQTGATMPSGSLSANKRAGTGADADAFLAKYGTDGTLQWARQFGTSSLDEVQAIAVDSTGNIYLTGETKRSLFGTTALGGSDAWMAQYNNSGTLLKASQFGTSKDDEANGIAIDSAGNVYIAGQTIGAFAGATNATNKYDAWIAKYQA